MSDVRIVYILKVSEPELGSPPARTFRYETEEARDAKRDEANAAGLHTEVSLLLLDKEPVDA